ncbi:DUF2274 domain-containing protein [Herbaspirillum sp. HC18]|nr:DUF2274 domain-containing protein [Herbaspirillum sp. HC18]
MLPFRILASSSATYPARWPPNTRRTINMPRNRSDLNQLSIGRIPKALPPEKASFKLPKILLTNLTLYKEAYKSLYNDDIEEDTLVELILQNHMAKDKAFQNWLKGQGKAGAKPREVPPPPATA